jgi:FtsP/CotA-like multicopper oxidase with cupredoxin domain
VNPVTLANRDGKLHVDLAAADATYTIGGHTFQGMVYNGQYMPQLWRVRAGDILTVTLHNQLSEQTNLHFHGLGVSPLNNGDNVFLHIAPGDTFTYQIKIPERHVGLFWYHPHAHGDVDRQIIGDMSGGILVEGSERLYPFVKGLTERVFLLKHHPIGRADYEELVMVNGSIAPSIPIRPGRGAILADRQYRSRPFFSPED